MRARRALRFLALALTTAFAGSALASSPALVIDVDSGKVLHAERATDPWFPASITKLMTTYVALQMVRDGTAAMDQLVTVSAEAASQPPSKMGFRPGTQLTLENALKIIMVKSANDIAAAIAEELGGSIDGFAAHMNEASRKLGMQDSRWVNPHGLPDDRQQTSARDMAILGRALLREFPDYAGLFNIGAIQFGKRVMPNHNGLVGRYPGVDGMKTGFICASGFNVVASATRGSRRLITVVMGAPSATERTLRAAALLDQGFGSFGWGGQNVDQLPPSSYMAPPNMRAAICERRGPVPAEEDGQPAAVPLQANANGNADNPSGAMFAPASALAFAGGSAPGGSAPGGARHLPPREKLQPVLVWIGPTPPAAMAKAGKGGDSAAENGAEPTRRIAARPARGGKAKAEPSVALAAPADSADDGGNKGAIRAKKARAVADEPKPGAVAANAAQRAKVGAIAAKPKAAQASAVSTKVATKAEAPAKKPAKTAAAVGPKKAASAKPAPKQADASKAAAKKPAKKTAAKASE